MINVNLAINSELVALDDNLRARTIRIIKDTLESMGWRVCINKSCEVSGQKWSAPLYAEKGKAKMAIEVLDSAAEMSDVMHQQALYINAGIRSLWLAYGVEDDVGYCALEEGFIYRFKDLPFFKFSVRDDGEAYVHNTFFYNDEYTDYDAITFRLPDFIKSMFSGDIYFKLRSDGSRLMTLITYPRECWRCKESTTVVAGIRYKEDVYGMYHEHIPRFDFTVRDIPQADINIINNQLASQMRFGTLKPRYSKTVNSSYMSNGCFHCDALLGAFFEEYDHEEADVTESDPILATHKHHCADIGE